MVNIKQHFIQLNLLRLKVDEYLAKNFMRAGYSRVELIKTPLGTRVIIYADRPALIIGRRGQTIRQLTEVLEKYFKIENPQITVTQVENPELDARVVATRLALAIERGYHFRRALFVALRRVMAAGAVGAEIVISGKLTSERARYEKLRAGKVYKTGAHVERLVDRAVVHLLRKPGMYGIEVIIVKPGEPDDIVRITPPEEVQQQAAGGTSEKLEEKGEAA
ncbi:MAG: 30S ribosomal protein S3 [Desulfurococcales archaeon]|nr:30S ribosomal protein S3 [Desulfurococcales archaeon]